MRTKLYQFSVFAVLAFFFVECGRPSCNNTNPLFDKYSPESAEYKEELVRQLEITDQSKLTYWFNQYVESNGQEQVFFNVQGDELCAVMVLDVEEWGKLEKVRQKKGISYRGAKFTHLKYDIKTDSSGTRFVYMYYSQIID
jgi:hypothetical protein